MVFTVVILLTADFVTGSLVLVMVGLVVLYLMGTYHLWGEHLNSITMTNAIVAIGISVDHSVHLAQAFKESIGSNAAERLKSAFDKVGLSVFNGGVSTFLAILSLVGAKSYIF